MLKTILGQPTNVKGDEVVFWCPRHSARAGRTEGHLSVNVKTDWFHCWNCGFGHQNILPILRLRKDLPEFQEYLEGLGSHKREEPAQEYAKPILPDGFKSLSGTHRGPVFSQTMAYLTRRGVTSDDIVRFKLGYTEEGPYRGRVIFPSFDDQGELNFFVGRDIWKNDSRKYMHGEFDKDIIFNDYLVDWERPVVLVEGPFDMIAVGENAIPLQGTYIRDDSRLFRKIVTTGVPTYFALDSDAFSKQLRVISRFMEYGVDVSVVDLRPSKDPSEMGRDRFSEAMKRAKRLKTDLDIMRMRLCA